MDKLRGNLRTRTDDEIKVLYERLKYPGDTIEYIKAVADEWHFRCQRREMLESGETVEDAINYISLSK